MLNKNILILTILTISLLFIGGCVAGGNETDSSGNVLVNITAPTDDNGNLLVNVTNPDQPRVEIPLDVFAVRVIGAPTTLANQTNVDSYTVIVNGGAWVVGDMLQITSSSTSRFYRGVVLNVAGNTLTMDRALDFMFFVGDIVLEVDNNMAVDGSTTPVTFQAGPTGELTEAFVSRVIFHCVDNAAADDTKFCGGPALTRGITMRYGDGEKFNIFNVKNNGDLVKLAYDVQYTDKAGGGNYAVASRLTWGGDSKQGTFLYIYNSTILEFIVQDDLTNVIEVTYTIEGFSRSVQ